MALLEKFRSRLRDASDYRIPWEKEAKKDFAFYSSDQWDGEDLTRLKEELRPGLVFNEIKKFVHAVSGSEITNRYEPKYFPRGLTGIDHADKITEIVRYIREQSNAEQEDSAAFRDMIICGVGCTEYFQDYETSLDGETRIERVPIFEMYWDPNCQKQNLRDATYLIREKWISLEDFKARWPDKEEEFFENVGKDSGSYNAGQTPHDATRPWVSGASPYYDPSKNRVKVYEYQWYEVETRYVAEIAMMNPQTMQVEVAQKMYLENDEESTAQQKLTELKEIVKLQGAALDFVRLPKRRYKRAFIAGDTILEEDNNIINEFTYKFLTAFEERKDDRLYWQGFVRDLRDPQQWANKFFSQMIHIVATNPKGAVIAKPGTFTNPAEARREWAKPNSFIQANLDPEDSIRIVEGKYPTGLEHLFMLTRDMLQNITGVNPSYFIPGVENLSRTANTAIQSVQRQTMVILSILFDSLRLYRKEQGRILLGFIKEFMPDGTLIRLADMEQGGVMQSVPFSREWIEEAEYDVSVDESPTSPSMRHDLWNSLNVTRSIEPLMNMGLLTPDIIAEIIPDVPSSVREKMKLNAANIMQMQQQMMMQGGSQQPQQ